MTTIRTCVLLMMLFCVGAPALAEGWSWSKLNPFSSDGSSTATKRSPLVDGKPVRSSKSKKSDEKSSIFTRMGAGTRNAWNNTREALTFGDNEEKSRKEGRHISWDDPSPYRRTKKKEESGWSWSSWWKRDEPRPSATVQDFLSQERPEAQ